jgi:hypothetical protein
MWGASTCRTDAVAYDDCITKPPEGLGVRLVSAGPLFFLLLASIANVGCAPSAERVSLHPAVSMQRGSGEVQVQATVACTRGDLEQVCCARGTREHESLLVTDAPASSVHAGLLALGLRSGSPGSWRTAPDGRLEQVPPSGSPIQLLVRWRESGEARETPVGDWLDDRRPGPSDARFVFAGSRFVTTPQGERFAADLSGSIVGLVTFGDEVIACAEVVPDRLEVAPPRWRARTGAMPAEGTPVVLVLRGAAAP